jgi:hypothetical protein
MDIRGVNRPLGLLLLLTTLSSAPMGSMEQGALESSGIGQAQLLPALRLDSTPVIVTAAIEEVKGSVRPEPPPVVWPKSPSRAPVELMALGVAAGRPADAEPAVIPSGCQLLPYYAIPPPPRI